MTKSTMLPFPEPRELRPVPEPLGLFLRPGRNDHRVLCQLLSEDRSGMSGIVFDAELTDRHEELREEACLRNLEAILDSRAMELSTVGGLTDGRAALPWGGKRPHSLADLSGKLGETLAHELSEFIVSNGFSAVLAPTHFLAGGTRDPWFEVDLEQTRRLRQRLDSRGAADVAVYYPIAVPTTVFFDKRQRDTLKKALSGLSIDGLWLRIHPFGSDSGHLSLRRYITACRDLHSVSLPLVAERAGNVGLALLGFGAVSSIESGVTSGDKFDFGRFGRKASERKPFGTAQRVYIPGLGVFLPRKDARKFFTSRAARASFACRNTTCCRRGADDMIATSRRHFVFTRMEEIRELGSVPATDRAEHYLSSVLRPATDRFGRALQLADDTLKAKLERHRARLDGWRFTLGEIARVPATTYSPVPLRRVQRRRSRSLAGVLAEVSHV